MQLSLFAEPKAEAKPEADKNKRWDYTVIASQIVELERLLSVLPSSFEGKWCEFSLHAPIKAQIEVLKTGKYRDDYKSDSVSVAALWAIQWMYRSVPRLTDDVEEDNNGFKLRPENLTEEWREFEKLVVG